MTENGIAKVEENEIVKVEENGFSVPEVANKFEKDFAKFATGLYLPRLSLEGSNSNNVKQDKIQKGSYALITGRDTFEDLGKRVDVLVLTYRSKALDLSDKKNILTSYDKSSPLFKSIMEKAQTKTSDKKGYMFGLEFLLYIPGAKNAQKFATFFCGNPTSRVAARNFAPVLKRAATLKSEIINNGTYIWEGPVILPCNTELLSYPSQDEMKAQMDTFLNPIEGESPEMADDEETSATDRVR